MKSILIIFTRFPTPGSTKTRLIPALGPEGAADLHRQMTEHTLAAVGPVISEEVALQVRYEGSDENTMKGWLGRDLSYVPQGTGDLGERMRRAFTDSFEEGFDKSIIIGTDCPSRDAADVEEALKLLEENTLVLGPAIDGGYYLIGIRSNAPHWLYELVFENIPWGTDQVFNATMNVLAETGIDVGLLDEKADVDEPEDLIHWEREMSTQYPVPGTQGKIDLNISVIIPALNEEEGIGEVLESLKNSGVQIVVADGGSTDGTVDFCEDAGVEVIRSESGRARQMNNGAAGAEGNVFIFLHADTRLPEGFEGEVKKVIAQGAAGGAFLFGTDMDSPSMGIIENMAHFRSIRMGIVFGDQAIFATREAFHRAGTYPDQPIMEDYELWKQLGKVGKRTIIPLCVTTSARKWQQYGTWKITFLHQAVMWMYLLGVGPERLAKWYRGKLRKMENDK
jgi:hypothetical protein